MTCDERRIVTYLAGDLDPDAAADFEHHLLGCESCWAAVRDDRRGRELAEQLRTLAPSGLRDRVRAGVELAATTPAARRGLPLRTLAAIAAAAVVVAGGTFVQLHRGGDPAVVRDVLALAGQPAKSKDSSTVRVYDGRRVRISMYEMHGTPVALARSTEPFPMPAHAMPLGGVRGEPWIASRDGMTLLCLSQPSHVLLAGHMPPADLLDFARGLGLAP
jgi:hypothetical protein